VIRPRDNSSSRHTVKTNGCLTDCSFDVAQAALSTGACGYIVKSDAGVDLLRAVENVLQGKQFVSASLTIENFNAAKVDHATTSQHCHEVAFFADDGSLVDGYARFIESALKNGQPVIVVATDARRISLFSRLVSDGIDVPAAMEQGLYIPLDTSDALSRLSINDVLDPVRCATVIGDLILGAAKGVKAEHGRVAVCGEISSLLLSAGNAEGAIKLEHLWDEITRGYDVHTLCGYLSSAFPDKEDGPLFEGICEEHSAVHGLAY
jgi:hypothetical protein